MASLGHVDIQVRPIKAAFLVDPNNSKQICDAIQLSSTLWGGFHFPIIPVHKQMPKSWKEGPFKAPKSKEVILGYIDAFDPDILIQFCKVLPEYLKGLGLEIIAPNEVWKSLEGGRNISPKYGIGLFEIYKDIFEKYFKYKNKYPVKIIIPKFKKQTNLFWRSWFGEIPNHLIQIIQKYYKEPIEIEEIVFSDTNFMQYLRGDTLFPRRVTSHDLEPTFKSGLRRNNYAFFMDISKVEDIVDYWNLRATGRDVMPIPKQLILNEQIRSLAIDFFKNNRKHWTHDNRHCSRASIVRSRNCTMEEMEKFAASLNLKVDPNDTCKDGYFSLQHWYPRIWDELARDWDGIIVDDYYGEESSIEIEDSEKLEISYKPLLPKFASKYSYHVEPRCINEISFRLYGSNEYLSEVFPKASGRHFLSSISSFGSFRDYWRVGHNGLVKYVKDNLTEHWDIPLSEKVFFGWLKDQGWEPKISPPGLLAKQIYKTFEGHPLALTNEKLLGLLERMNGGNVKLTGQPTTNSKITEDRELSIGEIKTRLANSDGPDDLCDFLVSKGIFHIGIRIQCPTCLRNSWYPVNQIQNIFSCPRCLNSFPAIGNIENGTWCYKTAGPFSVRGYADGAYATLLALQFFEDHRLYTLKRTPTLSFTASGQNKVTLEADFAMFWEDSIYGEKQSGVLFGECKTYGEYSKKDFDRMRILAKNFPGAILVFSTLRKSLSKREIKELIKISKMGRKYWKNERPINPVLILTGNELLTFDGPPHCWEKMGFDKKFDRVRGLISICDATQQIYLKLPSWHEEWQEIWEKKRKRKQNKIN